MGIYLRSLLCNSEITCSSIRARTIMYYSVHAGNIILFNSKTTAVVSTLLFFCSTFDQFTVLCCGKSETISPLVPTDRHFAAERSDGDRHSPYLHYVMLSAGGVTFVTFSRQCLDTWTPALVCGSSVCSPVGLLTVSPLSNFPCESVCDASHPVESKSALFSC